MTSLRFAGRPARTLAALIALTAAPVAAQSLSDRVSSGSDAAIQFSFSARPGVCGNGRGYVSLGSNTHIGSVNIVDGVAREACDSGPVRVVVNRAGSTIVSIESFVGTPAAGSTAATPPVRDLGRVPARQAAEYLLGLAARLEGRPARDALMPGALADSADVWQPLLAIARDPARPRELRTSALTWLGRVANELSAAPSGQVGTALVALASDENVEQTVRNQAMTTLSRLPRGEGIPALIQIVNTSPDLWLGKRAMSTLSGSGDPRAREALRAIADRANISDDIRLTAIRGIGQSYATGQDAAFLRQLYTKYPNAAVRESIIASVASVGGRENMQFLTNIAANPTEPVEARRSALKAAGGAEAPIAELVGLYGKVDRPMKEELITILGRRTEPGAVDKLISIAKGDEDTMLRRRAITQLSRSRDPRVAAALRDIIVP
jgi:HEAT repeat protein